MGWLDVKEPKAAHREMSHLSGGLHWELLQGLDGTNDLPPHLPIQPYL